MTSSPNRILQRTKRFARDIKFLPSDVQQEAFLVARQLSENIFLQALDVRPLTRLKGLYRVVVSKDYRRIFSFDHESIYLRRIAHRKDIYRHLEL